MTEKQMSWPGWETVRLIGRGSFGAVYEIQREMFGEVEKAALKVISIPQNENDIEELYSDGYDEESITNTFKNQLKSIVGEYSIMRKMNGHTNVVNCDDVRYVQHDDGIGWDIFIKMELLTPLTKALPAEIPEEMLIKMGRDTCSALELCRKHGIIHRDIKPQNIFVSSNGDFKLGDFGVAKTVEKTMGGTKIGTYKYMAPEVYKGKPYGSAADIYSLGLVLYWLLNERRMPFLPLPPAKLNIAMDEKARMRRLNGEPLPPPAHGSEALKQIVLKACAYDVADRYTSASEMLADLLCLTMDQPKHRVTGLYSSVFEAGTQDTGEMGEAADDRTLVLFDSGLDKDGHHKNDALGEEASVEKQSAPEKNSADASGNRKKGRAAGKKTHSSSVGKRVACVVAAALIVLAACLFFSSMRYTGWKEYSDGTVVYYVKGKRLTGWQDIEGNRYYFNDDGSMQTGSKIISGIYYYFGEDGILKNR